MDDIKIYAVIGCAFLLTLWIEWYAIPVIIAFVIIFLTIIYVRDRKKSDEDIGKIDGNTLLSGIFILSVAAVFVVATSMFLKGCINIKGPSREKIERRTKIHTSDGDKMPTMSKEGEYHNAGTGERQIEYGGSVEQKRDIEAADRLIEQGY